jgi:hypothetical protein
VGEVGLKRKLQRSHYRVGEFFIGCRVEHHGTGRLGHQIEQPFRHVLIERREHRQQIFFTPLLEERLERIDRRISVTMVVATGIDQMNQISGQGIGTRPTLHEILRAVADEP